MSGGCVGQLRLQHPARVQVIQLADVHHRNGTRRSTIEGFKQNQHGFFGRIVIAVHLAFMAIDAAAYVPANVEEQSRIRT